MPAATPNRQAGDLIYSYSIPAFSMPQKQGQGAA